MELLIPISNIFLSASIIIINIIIIRNDSNLEKIIKRIDKLINDHKP
jgi:uncharacterized protein YoxC